MLETMWKFVSRQSESWTLRLRWKNWGFTLKKLKLGRDPQVDEPLRKILKHQTEVDNNPWWLLPISIICIKIHRSVFFFFCFFWERETVKTAFKRKKKVILSNCD